MRDEVAGAYEAMLEKAIAEQRMCRVSWTQEGKPRCQLVAAEALGSFIHGLGIQHRMRDHSDRVYNTLIERGIVKEAEPVPKQEEDLTADVKFLETRYWIGKCPNPGRWSIGPLFRWWASGKEKHPPALLRIIHAARIAERLLRIEYDGFDGLAGGLEVHPDDALVVIDGYLKAAAQITGVVVLEVYQEGA